MGDLDDFKLDIFEIFGGELKAETPSAAPSPTPAKAASATAPSPSAEDEEKLLRAYEEKKQAGAEAELAKRMAALEAKFQAELEAKEKAIHEAFERGRAEAAKPAGGGSPAASGQEPEQIARKSFEVISIYEELRLILYYKLSPVVGEKATRTMLSKSYEKAREKHPDLLKGGNWDDKGNLLEDGGLNGKKIVENLGKLPPGEAMTRLEEALRLLLHLRLSAIQKGLGNQLTAGLAKSMSARIQELNGKHDGDCIKILSRMIPT